VTARRHAGASLAAISREAGLHKDWLSRHLHRVDPAAAAAARGPGQGRAALTGPAPAWLPALRRLGYQDLASYLRDRHLDQHQTVNAMAAELGVSHHSVAAMLRRHGLPVAPHAAKRHAARLRSAEVAAGLGVPAVGDYVAARRAGGWTWKDMAAESGQPQTWLRRNAPASS